MTQARVNEARPSPPRPLATASHPGTPGMDAPLKDVLVELWQNMEKLMRQELALASAEIDLKAQKLKKELTASAIGAALLLAGSLALVAALILLLALAMPAWIAALITGGVTGGIGFGLIRARRPSIADVAPQRALHSLKKDLQTFTEPTK